MKNTNKSWKNVGGINDTKELGESTPPLTNKKMRLIGPDPPQEHSKSTTRIAAGTLGIRG